MSPNQGLKLVRSSIPETPDLEQLFRRYAPKVGATALRILGRHDEAEDVIQEVFILAHARISRVRDPAAVGSWLCRIAVRCARRRLRRAWWRRVMSTEDPTDYETLADLGSSPEERAHVASVYRSLAKLPTDERIAWVLRHVQEEPLERIADLVGCSQSTVQRRLRRAQATMMEAMGHDG